MEIEIHSLNQMEIQKV